jgi:hypothetical protein
VGYRIGIGKNVSPGAEHILSGYLIDPHSSFDHQPSLAEAVILRRTSLDLRLF